MHIHAHTCTYIYIAPLILHTCAFPGYVWVHFQVSVATVSCSGPHSRRRRSPVCPWHCPHSSLPHPLSGGKGWEEQGGTVREVETRDCSLSSFSDSKLHLMLNHLNCCAAYTRSLYWHGWMRMLSWQYRTTLYGGSPSGQRWEGASPWRRRGAECAAAGAGPGSHPAAGPERAGLGCGGQRWGFAW